MLFLGCVISNIKRNLHRFYKIILIELKLKFFRIFRLKIHSYMAERGEYV